MNHGMKTSPDENTAAEREEDTDIIRSAARLVLIRTGIAVLILLLGMFSWWLGFILFIFFSLYVLQSFLVFAIVFLLEIGMMTVGAAWIRNRGFNLKKFETLKKNLTSFAGLNLILGLSEIYLWLLAVLLGSYFFISTG
jgi:cation transport ATPase